LFRIVFEGGIVLADFMFLLEVYFVSAVPPPAEKNITIP